MTATVCTECVEDGGDSLIESKAVDVKEVDIE